MSKAPSIIDLMADSAVFGPWFKGGASWAAWRVVLKVLFCLPLDAAELAIFSAATGRTRVPSHPVTELWLAIGRRGGKSLICAFVAVYLACFRSYGEFLAPGERPVVMVVASDRRQARVVLGYIRAFLTEIPMLRGLVVRDTQESLELANGVVLEVHTASFRSSRGYTLAAVINDELAWWSAEDSAQPDKEILAAQRPALTTIPGAVMLNVSSVYSRRGALFAAFEAHYGKDEDPVLFWKAPSRSIEPAAPVQMNPLIDLETVRNSYEEDSAVAGAEWGSEFRSDLEKLFTLEMLDRITDFDLPDVVPYQEEEMPS